jgi:hypothetical protein
MPARSLACLSATGLDGHLRVAVVNALREAAALTSG